MCIIKNWDTDCMWENMVYKDTILAYGLRRIFTQDSQYPVTYWALQTLKWQEYQPMKSLHYILQITHWECAVWSECCHQELWTPELRDQAQTQTQCIQTHVGLCLSVDVWMHLVLNVTSWCRTHVGLSPWHSQAWKLYVQWMARPDNHHGLFAWDEWEEQHGCGHLETDSSVHKTCTYEQYESVTCHH